MGCGAPLEMGGAHLPDERTYRVGMLVHDWLDHRRPEGRAAMTADRALTIVIMTTIILTFVVIIGGELLHRWRRR